MYYAVWGNANSGVEAGVLSKHPNLKTANRAVEEFLRNNPDSPVGAWVRKEGEEDTEGTNGARRKQLPDQSSHPMLGQAVGRLGKFVQKLDYLEKAMGSFLSDAYSYTSPQEYGKLDSLRAYFALARVAAEDALRVLKARVERHVPTNWRTTSLAVVAEAAESGNPDAQQEMEERAMERGCSTDTLLDIPSWGALAEWIDRHDQNRNEQLKPAKRRRRPVIPSNPPDEEEYDEQDDEEEEQDETF